LKEKLIAVSVEYEREIIKLMENSVNKTPQLEKLNEDYIDAIQQLKNKILDLSKDKEDFSRQLE
jgi:hypothetical protein